MTTREMQERIENLESELEGVKLSLAEVLNSSRIVAVSTPAPVAEEELSGSHAWRDRGRGGEDVPTPAGAIPADHTGRCPACNGAIRLGELIVKVRGDYGMVSAGSWVHEECSP